VAIPSKKTRIIWTAIIVCVLILIFTPATRKLFFEQHLFRAVDAKSTEYVDSSLKNAGTAFVLARGFNAVVSVFQESEIQLEPAGVGVSLALGQALDPVNDLVERFSWVMLVSLTSLGIQKFLIEVTPFVSIQILLSLALMIFLVGLWLPRPTGANFTQVGKILFFAAILIRFAVPAMAFLNHQVYVGFLENRHDRSVEKLSQATSTMKSYALDEPKGERDSDPSEPLPEQEKKGVSQAIEKFSLAWDQGKRILDVNARFKAVRQLAQDMIETIVDLIVVFTLSTIVLPLAFLWGIIRLGKLIGVRGFDVLSIRRIAKMRNSQQANP